MLVLPFEPRRPTLALGGVQLTLLEAVAALATLALLAASRRSVASLLARPPAPLLFLAAYAGVHLLSAVLARAHREAALKFALRMAACGLFALVVAAAPRQAHRRALGAFVAAALAVASLAILEAAGLRSLDPLLDLFRAGAFRVGELRRSSAGSEHPNLAAALLAQGLLAAAALGPRWPASKRAVLLAFPLSLALLLTYSRGALASACLGLVVLAVARERPGRDRANAPLGALAVLAAAFLAFAALGATFRLRLATAGAESWYGARYELADTTLSLSPGESRAASIRVVNTGRQAWTADGPFSLSHHWYDTETGARIEGRDAAVPRRLEPGEGDLITVAIEAPPRAGRYVLVWDMRDARTGAFSGFGVPPAMVPASVGGAPAGFEIPDGAVPVVWGRGRAGLWHAAVSMWREHPLLGAGPDNFRRLHAAQAGWPASWDTDSYANNTYLEIAATTGSLGLMAFLGVLVSTSAAAARRLSVSGATPAEHGIAALLLAATAGLATHGLVDYTLAFTGHYLFLGFVVGAASAPADTGRAA
jgi:hypothetical protein